MRYDLIACFYENAADKAPRYESPLGIYHETHIGDLESLGFKENPDSTPGYLDYIKEGVTEDDLQDLTENGYISEVMDVLNCGTDFARIDIRAMEIDTIDDEGTIPPFGLFVGGTFIEFSTTDPFSPVWFIEGDPYDVTGNTRTFGVPLKKLKDYFEVLTMYEVRDSLKDSFAKGGSWSYDELKDYFESGFDDAVDLATRKLFGLRDPHGNPLLMHSLPLGLAGRDKTEQVVGFLWETVDREFCSPDELTVYGFSQEVVDTLTLLLLLEQGETDELHYKRILRSGNAAAVHVLEARLSQEVEYETRCRCWNRRKIFLTQLEILRSLMDNPAQRQK